MSGSNEMAEEAEHPIYDVGVRNPRGALHWVVWNRRDDPRDVPTGRSHRVRKLLVAREDHPAAVVND